MSVQVNLHYATKPIYTYYPPNAETPEFVTLRTSDGGDASVSMFFHSPDDLLIWLEEARNAVQAFVDDSAVLA